MPGTTDIGNHGDDTVTTIALPFSYTFYDQTFTSINLSSNGNAQFTTTDNGTSPTDVCRGSPTTTRSSRIGTTCIWPRQRVRHIHVGKWHCAQPHLQHRVARPYFTGPSSNANFELRLYEGQSALM